MKPFFCTVKVLLDTPVKAREASGKKFGLLIGYYRNIGIRALDITQVKKAIEGLVDDGEIVWDDTVVHDFHKIDPKISRYYADDESTSVWYISGRILYPAEDSNL